MKASEARQLGREIADHISQGDINQAYQILDPVISQRTPFAKLDLIGEEIGSAPRKDLDQLLDLIADHQHEGGWPVIGSALRQQIGNDLTGSLERCGKYIRIADVWYGADILGERVPGPALRSSFSPTLTLLSPWRDDQNVWIRRSVGVAVHFWAKRSQGAVDLTPKVIELLDFIAPMVKEWEISAAKGVGWGLKTIGKYYPGLLTDWLRELNIPSMEKVRAVIIRKAATYLTDSQRSDALLI